MQYTINEFRKEVFKGVYQVYGVFSEFFGEDMVDLQKIPSDTAIINAVFQACDIEESEHEHVYDVSDAQMRIACNILSKARPFILVYWPRVIVTNENNKSIIIQDLYAKIELDINGNIPTENRGFTLNRATYPMDQWVSGYLHSHIMTIPKSNLTDFQVPCLGSGPIIATINSLRTGISEGFDEIKWMLFCQELSLYVTVESLKGIPYKKLEEVHLSDRLDGFDEYNKKYGSSPQIFRMVFEVGVLKDFILYYLRNGHLSISYQAGKFKPGMPYFDYMIDISNFFIEYFNSHFKDKELACKCFDCNILYHTIVSGRKFLLASRRRDKPDTSTYIGQKVCTFKGQDITLRILDTPDGDAHETTVLSHGLAMFILNNILKVINYRYKNEHISQQDTRTLPATIGQRVYYI